MIIFSVFLIILTISNIDNIIKIEISILDKVVSMIYLRVC